MARLAARQEGVLARNQVEALGITSRQVDGLVRDGRLLPVFHGVFALGRDAPGARARMRAAALACPGAVISHRSAAALLGIGKEAPVVVDLIPTVERGRRIAGIKPHRVPYPGRSESGYVHGIPVTSVARTIVDLAGTYGEERLRETVELAATERLLDPKAIDAVLANGPKRRGAPCLRRIVDEWRPVAETAKHATFRSLFEAKLLPLVAAAGLPLPRFNAPVRTAEQVLEVDLLWEKERFVVEADSRKHHGIEVAFERDHLRARELIAAGYRILGVTWREAETEAPAVFAVIRQELAQRASLGGAATEDRPSPPH
ncbi:MAG TPA: type IV toxin-antitoxin system AbiEi family antitoxin domain-containing protein [Solirubrobacterales bacterium]|nr:type IV toxin-antitoxin system AbiEi family antitoxin domain-containing protein [Solirubrobacterales bacterium]